MEQTVVYVNPASGSGRGLAVWRRLLAAEPSLARAALVLDPELGAAERKLAEALRGGARRVIAVGGDGTAQLAVRQILRAGLGERTSLGLVPAGTGSDLARCLELPREPVAALGHLLGRAPRPLDLIRLRSDSGEERLAVNVASAGVSGEVARAVGARAKRGRLPYLRSTVSALLGYEPAPCRVRLDGEAFYEGGFFVLAVANGRYFGNGMRVAPRAVPDDGLLDVVLVPPLPLWQLPYRLPLFVAGRHPAWPGVLCRRARTVRIEPLAAMPPFELDGEVLPPGPAELGVLPRALRVLA